MFLFSPQTVFILNIKILLIFALESSIISKNISIYCRFVFCFSSFSHQKVKIFVNYIIYELINRNCVIFVCIYFIKFSDKNIDFFDVMFELKVIQLSQEIKTNNLLNSLRNKGINLGEIKNIIFFTFNTYHGISNQIYMYYS